MSSTSLLFNFLKGRDTVSAHLGAIAARAQATSTAINSMGKVGKIMYAAFAVVVAGAASQVMAFTAAIGPMLNIIAALPAALFAAGAGILALVVGFRHFGAALKTTASGAGRSGEAIAAAERRVEQAQRAALKAQQAVNDARAEASRRLADMARELARAHLDERSAILSVSDAKRQLREARNSGDRSEVERARIAYEESVLTLEDVRQKLADVTKEDQKRQQQGVEGSDEVQQALERQAEAMQNLADAQRALHSGGGGTDKAAQAYAKLTAEGKALVDVLKAMGKAWGQVRQAVQSTLFSGVAADVQKLSERYLPVMKQQLPAIAQGWNNAFRGTAQISTTAGFVRDMNTSLGNTATLWQKVGNAFAPFWSGFRHWIVIGSSFFPRLGAWVERMGQSFDKWSEAQRKTGRGMQWIERALEVGHQFNGMLGAIREATFEIFKTSMSPGLIDGLTKGAEGFAAFIKSADGQERVTHLFTELKSVWSQAWVVLKQFLDLLTQVDFSGVVGGLKVLNVVLAYLGDHLDLVNWALTNLLPIYVAHRLIVTSTRIAYIAWKTAIGTVEFYTTMFGKTLGLTRGLITGVKVATKDATGATIANSAATNIGATIHQKFAAAMKRETYTKMAAAIRQSTIAQWALNAAQYANPTILIVIAILALIAIFVLLWVKCAWFRNFWIKTWEIIKTAALWTWNNVLKPTFTKIAEIAVWLWNHAIKPAFNGIKKAWEFLSAGIAYAWNFWSRIFRSIAALAWWLWQQAISPVVAAVKLGFSLVADVLVWLWNNVTKPIFEAIGAAAMWLWNNAIKPAWDGIVFGAKLVGAAATWLWQNAIKPAWDAIAAGASWLWNKVLKPTWDKITDGLSTVGGFFKRIFSKIGSYISDGFSKGVDLAKGGLNFLIGLLNKAIDGINVMISGLNKVPGVDFPTFGHIPTLAKGGIIPATPGGRLVIAGEGGEDEVIAPLSKLRGMGPSSVNVTLSVDSSGSGDPLLWLLRKYIREGKLRIETKNGVVRLAT